MLKEEVQNAPFLGSVRCNPGKPPRDGTDRDGQAGVAAEHEGPDGVQKQGAPPEVHDRGRCHHQAIVLERRGRQICCMPVGCVALPSEVVLYRARPEFKIREEDYPADRVDSEPVPDHDPQHNAQSLVLEPMHLGEMVGRSLGLALALHVLQGFSAGLLVRELLGEPQKALRYGKLPVGSLHLLPHLHRRAQRRALGPARLGQVRHDLVLVDPRRAVREEAGVRARAPEPSRRMSDTRGRGPVEGRPIQALLQFQRHPRLHPEGEPSQQDWRHVHQRGRTAYDQREADNVGGVRLLRPVHHGQATLRDARCSRVDRLRKRQLAVGFQRP
mmetsp:Transcript_103564/g.251474  ORF Transcript_103564/g.251474 Transcript_103564/m.251474 type:complete len:329 (-) Transcript_103564:272-1258(-)